MTNAGLQRVALALAVCLTVQGVLAYSGEIYRVCGLGLDDFKSLRLRECIGTDCDEIIRLAPGTYVWTIEPNAIEGWRKVVPMRAVADMFTATPHVGYVDSHYICEAQ